MFKYKVQVTWGNKTINHTAKTLSEAKAWMYKYPAEDVIATVKRFNRTLAVRYYR